MRLGPLHDSSGWERSATVVADRRVRGGEPCLWGTLGARVTDLLDRVDAGDSVEEVAQDFSCDPGSLELLVGLRETLFEQVAAELTEDAEGMAGVAQNAADKYVRDWESGRMRGVREAAGRLRSKARQGEKA